jgi:hypothetical protein
MAIPAPDANLPEPPGAPHVARWLAMGAVAGGALLIASYFMTWNHYVTPAGGAGGGYTPPPVVPIQNLSTLHGAYAFYYVALPLFAPPVIAALGALGALAGPRWSRMTLSLLSALAGAYSLTTCLNFISSSLSSPTGTYAIDTGAYIGVCASLLSFCAASGLLLMALAGAWRALAADAPRARLVTRRWARLVVGGAALLIVSYFMPWSHFYLSNGPNVGADPTLSHSAPWPLDPVPAYSRMPVNFADLASISPPYLMRNLLMLGLVFFAPPLIAALFALFALIGPRWSRVTLSLLSALLGALVLLVSVGYLILSGFTDTALSSVIDLGAYLGIGASLLIVVAAVGLVFSTLNSAWRAPAAGTGGGARAAARMWVTLVAVGSAALVVSYFMMWGHWLTPGISEVLSGPNDHHRVVPITLLVDALWSVRFVALPLLFGPPAVAVTCALLALRAPRQNRLRLSLLTLLGGGLSLAVALALAWSILSRSRLMGTFDSGVYIGLAAAALTAAAAFGLLSTPPGVETRPQADGTAPAAS